MIILGPSNTTLTDKNQQEKEQKSSGSKSSSKSKGKERMGILHMITIGPSIDVLLDKSQPATSSDRTLLKRKAKDRANSMINEGPSKIDDDMDIENDEEDPNVEENPSSEDDKPKKKKKKKSTIPINSDVFNPSNDGRVLLDPLFSVLT
jgi:hypothetical protein